MLKKKLWRNGKMIDRMTKYFFILLSGETEGFLKKLETLGLVDVTRSTKPVDEKSAALFASTGELQKAISKLSGIDFSKDPDIASISAEASGLGKIDNPLERFKAEYSRLESLKAELAAARKEVESLREWGRFDKARLDRIASLGYRIRYYEVPKKKYDPSWANLYPLQEVFDNGKKVWFITISDDQDYSLPVDECAAPEGDLSFAEKHVESIQKSIISSKAILLSLKVHIPALQEAYGKEATELQRHLAEAGAGKAADELVTTFVGFAPVENEDQLTKEFDAMGVLYLKDEAAVEDNPPIKLKSNRFTGMFQVLTDMYGRPDYNEFDPTPYLSIFFLLFFAMCMGDSGYGLALIVIGLLLRKSEGMRSLSPLVTTLGVGTFVIGFLMHTFFGYDMLAFNWLPDWAKSVMVKGNIAGFDANMVLSIIIGIIHLCLAMSLKAIYAIKKNGFLGSLGTIGWTLLIVGGVTVGAVSLAGVLDKAITKWIVIAIGVISALGIFLFNDIKRNPLKNIGSGLWETYNTVTGLLGDVLSYLRLYALGLAGGMLGKAFNDIAAMTLGDGGGIGIGIILFAVIFVIGHTLNLAMCCLGAFVHPLRLNFLEFFKNSGYNGKGRTYSPLSTESETNK